MSEPQARTINALAAEIANLRDRLAAAERARDEAVAALKACVEVLTVMEGGSELMESEKPVLARARAVLEGGAK